MKLIIESVFKFSIIYIYVCIMTDKYIYNLNLSLIEHLNLYEMFSTSLAVSYTWIKEHV